VKNMRLTVFSFGLAALVFLIWPASALAATDPGLATAAPFGVLAGSTVTNTGATTIAGQLGLAPGSAVVGFPPGTSGAQHIGDAVAITAKTDLTAAYTNAAAQPCPAVNDRTGVNLGGQTLVPGVYCQTTAPTLSGTLTLNGSGIYIFQIGSTLITAPGAVVALIGGAQPCQVYWQVGSSATLDTTTTFIGTIMALTDITMNNGVTLTGRALARNGQVALISDTIIQPAACLAVGPSPSPSPPASPSASPAPGTTPSPGVGLPGTGVPFDMRGEFPWLLLIGGSGALGAIALGVSSARRRRRKT
jgi:Ice-binding-like